MINLLLTNNLVEQKNRNSNSALETIRLKLIVKVYRADRTNQQRAFD